MKTPIVYSAAVLLVAGAAAWLVNRPADSDVVPTPEAPMILDLKVNAQSAAVPMQAGTTPPASGATDRRDGSGAGAGPWPNTEIVNALRDVDATAASYRAALAKALPVLATDQDVQLLVGDLLIGHGDPIDGLAWQLLACRDCTQVDERIGYGCAAEGLCDPNLALVDVFRRDFGEQAVAEALARMEEIQARISINDPAALAIFTQIDDSRFPSEGECVQLRTPTEECPPAEILRQTGEPQNINGRLHDTQPH